VGKAAHPVGGRSFRRRGQAADRTGAHDFDATAIRISRDDGCATIVRSSPRRDRTLGQPAGTSAAVRERLIWSAAMLAMMNNAVGEAVTMIAESPARSA
jgi:hypothetical protein